MQKFAASISGSGLLGWCPRFGIDAALRGLAASTHTPAMGAPGFPPYPHAPTGSDLMPYTDTGQREEPEDELRRWVCVAGWPSATADELIERRFSPQAAVEMFADAMRRVQ